MSIKLLIFFRWSLSSLSSFVIFGFSIMDYSCKLCFILRIFLFWAAGVIFIGEDAQDHGLFDSYHYHRVTHLAPLDYWTRCWRSALVGKPLKQTPSQPLSNAHSNHIVAAQWPGDDQSTMGHRCSWSSVVIRSTVTDTLPWNLPWTVPWWCDVSHPSSSEASIYYSHNWQLTAKCF